MPWPRPRSHRLSRPIVTPSVLWGWRGVPESVQMLLTQSWASSTGSSSALGAGLTLRLPQHQECALLARFTWDHHLGFCTCSPQASGKNYGSCWLLQFLEAEPIIKYSVCHFHHWDPTTTDGNDDGDADLTMLNVHSLLQFSWWRRREKCWPVWSSPLFFKASLFSQMWDGLSEHSYKGALKSTMCICFVDPGLPHLWVEGWPVPSLLLPLASQVLAEPGLMGSGVCWAVTLNVRGESSLGGQNGRDVGR